MWSPDPQDVFKFRATGSANMGNVANDSDRVRYGLDAKFVLVYFRVWVGSGTSTTALLSLKQRIASERTGTYDLVVREFPSFGTGGDTFIPFRVHEKEYAHWVWDGGDMLVPEWTNPDSGNMIWQLEIGLALTPE